MNDFLYNRHDNCFAFMADRRHLENLSADRDGLNFRVFSKKSFVDRHFSCVRLLADAHAASFDSFLSNGKLFCEQSKLRIVS